MPAAEPPKSDATEDLLPLVYDELRLIAHGYFRKQAPGFTLRPTDIVNEACLHLLKHSDVKWEGPEHFRAIATRKIWQVIVDHLKHRHAQKRGGRGRLTETDSSAGLVDASRSGVNAAPTPRHRVPVESVAVELNDQSVDLLDLAEAMDALGAESKRLQDIVMLHWFGGLKYTEVGRVLDLSSSTVEKDFRYALAWLSRQLTRGADDAD